MKICQWPVVAIALIAARGVTAEKEAAPAGKAIDTELLKQVQEVSKAGLLVETFEETTLEGTRWFKSTHEKYTSQEVKLDEYTVRTGHLEADRGLVLDAPAKHYGLAVKLENPLVIDGSDDKKELVVQYEVKLQKGLSCGGAYVKLLRENESGDYTAFDNETPFVVMFGPDKCGASDKVHFIFQHKNPLTGAYEEKHLDAPPSSKSDRLTHLYTLVVRDDNSFEVLIDQQSVSNGTLLENFTPAVIPPKEIEDPDDKKPADWVDDAEIVDVTASKPDDWDEDAPSRILDENAAKPENWLDDEPAMIDDPAVKKPEDWDDEDDGEWVAPQIPNPKCEAVAGCGEWVRPTMPNPDYKGKWKAPMIPNPEYKGEWKPRNIPNPDYFDDQHPARMDPIGALAVEVWTMSEGITFDNFWLGNDFEKAAEFAKLTWAPKHTLEVEEQEAQRAKEQKELEEQRAKEGSIVQQLKGFVNSYVEFAKGNPVVGVGALFVVGLVIVLGTFFVCCGKSDAPAPKEKAESEDEGKDDAKEASESKGTSSEEESEGKPKMRQRKKAPVVRDD